MSSQRQIGQPPPPKRAKTGHQQRQQQERQPEFHRLLEISQINLLSREVQNWIYEQCALSDHIEIEAKLGKLLCYKENDVTMDENEEKGEEIRIHDKIGLKSLGWIDLYKTGGHFESTVT
eukprot:397141_1